MNNAEDTPVGTVMFSLFEGGPFARVQAILRLAGTEPCRLRRKILVAVAVAWIPLVVLAALQCQAIIGPNWHESVLLDAAMYARFWVALPLLILATPGFRRSFQTAGRRFLNAELVKEPERGSFFGDFNPTVTAMQKLNTLPFWPKQLVPLLVAALLPFLPVAAMEIPLAEILTQLWKLVK